MEINNTVKLAPKVFILTFGASFIQDESGLSALDTYSKNCGFCSFCALRYIEEIFVFSKSINYI